MKVIMNARHSTPWQEKLERGLIYDLPGKYADELINHGIAVLVLEAPVIEAVIPIDPPVNVNLKPTKGKTLRVYGKGKK